MLAGFRDEGFRDKLEVVVVEAGVRAGLVVRAGGAAADLAVSRAGIEDRGARAVGLAVVFKEVRLALWVAALGASLAAGFVVRAGRETFSLSLGCAGDVGVRGLDEDLVAGLDAALVGAVLRT